MNNEKKPNIIAEKSFLFAVRIVKLYQHLSEKKKEFVLSKQILRSGTAQSAQTLKKQKAQFQKQIFQTKFRLLTKKHGKRTIGFAF
jgi:conserved hypothetical protein TIGR02436